MARKRTGAEAQNSPKELAAAAKLIDVRPPAEELRALATARIETLAKLGRPAAPGASSGDRLARYAEALELGLRKLAEAGARKGDAGAAAAEEEPKTEPGGPAAGAPPRSGGKPEGEAAGDGGAGA